MSSSERHQARELVRKFAAKSAGGVFAHLKRSDIAAGLLKRLDDPGLIRQGTSSLCGPAALLFNTVAQAVSQQLLRIRGVQILTGGARDDRFGSD